MRTLFAALCALLVWTSLAGATPQIAVRSADNCGTCHVDPIDWENPALDQRKCSLNCTTCHVVPTGGGMRNESGLYYGQVTLPTWLKRDVPPVEYHRPALDAPTTQPDAAGSQPDAAGSQPDAAGSQPDAAGSQPDAAGSQPTTTAVAARAVVPAAGTAARYAGIEPFPFFQVGADVRFMAYVSNEPGETASFFPMETDLQLALRPYNPRALNQGRLTLYASPAALGARNPEGLDPEDRFFVREYFAMYHDLPYQVYARVGRFLPAFGWKLDDHTAFIRQEQRLLGAPFDHERGVTGVEVGVNPNYFFAHLSAFNASSDWMRPVDGDAGWGTALHAGWRDLAWHVAGSAMVGGSEVISQQMVGANWALNLAPLGWMPLSYLGEYDVNRSTEQGAAARTGLAAFHELNYWLHDGVNLKTRYEWQDSDIEAAYDSRHRWVLGAEWHPVRHLELIAQYRHKWSYAEDRWSARSDDMFLQVHGWY
jgi:hypothetical protein